MLKAFETAANNYDEWYDKPIGTYVFQSELTGLKKLLPLTGTGVDIGAGTGIFTEQLTTDKRKIICIDPSPEMLKFAKRRYLDSILAISENLPIKPKSIDFAYMVTVLEFLSEPFKALESIRGMLKVNSSLVILFINKESSWGKKYSEQAKLGDPIFSHARLYRPKEVVVMLKNSNYVPEELVGTITSPPDKLGKKVELVKASSYAGVILIEGRKI